MAFAIAMRRAASSSSSSLLARFLNTPPPTNTASSSASAAAAVATFNNNRAFSSGSYSYSQSPTIPIVGSSEENCTITSHGGSYPRSEQFSIERGIWEPYTENPFQISGPRGAYEAKKVEEGLFVRMEMPGIDKDDVQVWSEYGTVYVKGEGKKESRYEDSGRTYSATLEVPSNCFQPDRIKAKIKNGVLRMIIPKSKKPHVAADLASRSRISID